MEWQKGVRTGMGIEIESHSVVLTNGTFLNGLIHIGEKQFGGGRAGEKASKGITEQLVELGFESGRMKTGTPPRVDGRSLDWGSDGTPTWGRESFQIFIYGYAEIRKANSLSYYLYQPRSS